MNIVKSVIEQNAADRPLRQGPAGQQARLDLKKTVRRRVVDLANRLVEQGCTRADAAELLGMKRRTLDYWSQHCRDESPALPIGRPLTTLNAPQQQAVLSVLERDGPGVGVPTLRRCFDGLARAALDAFVKDYRRAWRAQNQRLLHVLEWRRPGTVWAMDFAQAPCLIDSQYPYLLAVRDLASGRQLLWQPVMAPTAKVVLAELELLFALHGAPWVLKTDNGSAFIADALAHFLQRCRVCALFSPPHTPEYNGAIEASIGSAKRRTELHSALAGHPGIWASADVAWAFIEANASCPRRLHGLTPDEVWGTRRMPTSDERDAFLATVAAFRLDARAERGLSADEELTRGVRAAVDRVALSRALVAHDLLLFRRRSIPARIPRPKVAN
jgi:transposase InsO family protein